MEQEKPNSFAEMQAQKNTPTSEAPVESQPVAEPISGEIDISDLSDTAVGDKVKYVRPELNGTNDIVEKYQVFMPGVNDDVETSRSGNVTYKKVSQIITYASTNSDGVNNREYISGGKCFIQKDGSLSAPDFWYEGSETQSAMLWEKVSEALNIGVEDLSPRQFVAFLNSKPGVEIAAVQYKNYGADKGAPAKIAKNMPSKFIKA